MTATTIGVIGCGYWGPNLLRNFSENESAELRWMCDLDEDRLETEVDRPIEVAKHHPIGNPQRPHQLALDPGDVVRVAQVGVAQLLRGESYIEDVPSEALGRLVGPSTPLGLTAAGRTDAGVHAVGRAFPARRHRHPGDSAGQAGNQDSPGRQEA